MLNRLVCPIGVDGISGKKPAEIAVSVAAEVLKIRELVTEVEVEEYPENVHPIGPRT
jgi:xanthine/CO dehydrogenase XdhC/CoxF family maturation factor